MDTQFLSPRTPLPTRFVCPRHRFTEHEVFAFIILRLINPEIELMRSPKFGDFEQHPDWYVIGYDEVTEERTQETVGTKKYGPMGLTFAKYWPYLADKDIINGEAVADIIDAEFCQKVDYAYVYANAGGLSYTFHSHLVDLFNPFEEHREDPEVMSFDYEADEAFIDAADAFQPILIRQFYWANNLISERIMVENACRKAADRAIEIDQFVDVERVKPILQRNHIRWLIWDYDRVMQVMYVDPEPGSVDVDQASANRDTVRKMIGAHEGVVTYDPSNLTARFNVRKDINNFLQQCDSLMYPI